MSAAPLKVLVIDDEPPIRKLLRMGLSTQGYEILEAPNARTSLQLLAQNPDLDIYFGDAAHIRSDHHAGRTWGKKGDTPIVVITGARHA
jgi:two-component system KDP operon response regulator KdpE